MSWKGRDTSHADAAGRSRQQFVLAVNRITICKRLVVFILYLTAGPDSVII